MRHRELMIEALQTWRRYCELVEKPGPLNEDWKPRAMETMETRLRARELTERALNLGGDDGQQDTE